MEKIKNPILKGFNPDPSIVRVGCDYYIATSTFEWFPGVQIHHSKDLKNWRLITRLLDNPAFLDLKGIENSGGIWAPCLTYSDGIFYLLYTIVRTWHGFKDTHNYLITSKDILEPWSEPIYLNSNGFDPSLFHDDDGRKWYTSMTWDHTRIGKSFAGILLQEYSSAEKRLIGKEYIIVEPPAQGKVIEGPHIYKRNEYYYLILAEGGTGKNHHVTVRRSKSIYGPYDEDPANPILTSMFSPENPLQKAGHADIVETQNGEWFMVHLCGRFVSGHEKCILGRETAIQRVFWTDDGWLRMINGKFQPEIEVEVPALSESLEKQESVRDEFNDDQLNIHFQTMRIPADGYIMSLTARKGFLRLYGRESLNSKFYQALIARRQQAFIYTATCAMEFNPESYKQMAGLICIYDTDNYLYLHMTHSQKHGRLLGILKCDNQKYSYPVKDLQIGDVKRLYLKLHMKYDRLQFSYSIDENEWLDIGEPEDATILSDEHSGLKFTGAFVGVCCQDLAGMGRHADFDWFEYIEGGV